MIEGPGGNGPRRIVEPGAGGVKGVGGPMLHPDIIKQLLAGKTPRLTLDVAVNDESMHQVVESLQSVQKLATEVLALIDQVIAKAKTLEGIKDAVHTE